MDPKVAYSNFIAAILASSALVERLISSDDKVGYNDPEWAEFAVQLCQLEEEACEANAALAGWLANGGFFPEDGDASAYLLAQKSLHRLRTACDVLRVVDRKCGGNKVPIRDGFDEDYESMTRKVEESIRRMRLSDKLGASRGTTLN